ncbi:MAG: hypothetical protein U9R27_05855 [Campylobacterota bacterium]|nr:hypothetical protein [Campylobacterota bacterium]
MNQLFISLLISSTLLLHADIGRVELVSGDTHLERSGQKIPIEKILVKLDRVITGEDGKVKIVLKDNTNISMGKNSMLLIDDYLLGDTSSDEGSKFFDTITMKLEEISPERFNISEKTAVMGIRAFDDSDNNDTQCTDKLEVDKKSKMVKISNIRCERMPLTILVKESSGETVYKKSGISDISSDLEIPSAVLKSSYILMVVDCVDKVEFCKTVDKN